MRRLIVVVPLMMLLGAGMSLAAASIARSRGSAHPGPAKPAVRSITLSSDPNPSTVGEQVVLSGRIRGTRVGGLRVRLWRKLSGDRQFGVALATRADPQGDFEIALSPSSVSTNREWYVSALGVRSPILS